MNEPWARPSPSEQTPTPPSSSQEGSPTADLPFLPPVCLSREQGTVGQDSTWTPSGKGGRGPWEAFSFSKSFFHNLGPNSLSLTKLSPSSSSHLLSQRLPGVRQGRGRSGECGHQETAPPFQPSPHQEEAVDTPQPSLLLSKKGSSCIS